MLFENRFVIGLGFESDRLRKKNCRIGLVNQDVAVVEQGTAVSAFLRLAVVDYLGSVGNDERIVVVLCDKQFRLLAFAYECVFVGAECVQRSTSGDDQKRKAKRQYFECCFHLKKCGWKSSAFYIRLLCGIVVLVLAFGVVSAASRSLLSIVGMVATCMVSTATALLLFLLCMVTSCVVSVACTCLCVRALRAVVTCVENCCCVADFLERCNQLFGVGAVVAIFDIHGVLFVVCLHIRVPHGDQRGRG